MNSGASTAELLDIVVKKGTLKRAETLARALEDELATLGLYLAGTPQEIADQLKEMR